MFTLKGKASLEFGKKFLKNDKSISEIANKSSDYWIEKAREIKFGDITDKVVGEIYRIKSKILLDEYDPKRSFEVLVNNHGSSQVSESFWRLFKEEYDFDEDEGK